MSKNSIVRAWWVRLACLVGLQGLLVSTGSAATIVWTNTAGGLWSVAANWSPNLVPGKLDSVSIALDGTYTVTANSSINAASLTLGGLNGKQTLSIVAGTFTPLSAPVVTANGVLTMTAGTLGGAAMNIQGTMNWTAGTLKSVLNVLPGGVLNISGNSVKYLNGGQLANAGTVSWSGSGGLQFGEGGTITNSGTFEIFNDALLVQTLYTTRPWFANSGVLRKRTANGTTTFGDVEFRNTGMVDVQSGIVSLSSKSHSFSGNTAISGAGQFHVAGATLNLSGTVNASSPLRITAGKANGAYTLNGDLLVAGGQTEGDITLNGNLNVASGKDVSTAAVSGNLNISGGEAAGVTTVAGNINLSGGTATGTISVNGNLNWSAGLLPGSKVTVLGDALWAGGSLSGKFAVPAGRVMTIPSGANANLSGGSLTNYGTLIITSGASLKCDSGANLYNYGDVVVNDGIPFTSAGSSLSKFWNYGTLRKTGSGVTKWKDLQLTSAGTIEAQEGILSMEGTLTHSLNASSQITGTGRFVVNGPIVNLGAGVTCPGPFELAGGTVVAAGAFNGDFTWTGGALGGSLILSAERQMLLSGNGTKTLNKDAILQTAGITIMSGGSLNFFANAIINNTGLFEFQNDGGFNFNGSDKAWFINAGTLRKTVSGAVLPFGALQLVNSGTLDLQAGDISLTANVQSLQSGSVISGPGAVRVNGATLSLASTVTSASPVYLASGFISGSATLSGPLVASGGDLSGAVTVHGPVTWSGGEVSGTLTVKQTMDWSGGTISGTLMVPAAASLSVKSGGTRTLSGVLNNAGFVIVQPSAFITLVGGTPFLNSGVFEVQDALPFKLSGSGKPVFNNSGTFRKSVSTQPLSLSFLILQNNGTVDVQAGAINFTLNTHTFASGSQLTGPGTVRIAGATVAMASMLRVQSVIELASGFLIGDATIEGSLSMSGGQLPGVVVVTNAFNWSGGEVKGTLTVGNQVAWSVGTLSGTLNIPARARLDAQPGATKLLTGTLNNYGTLILPALTQIQMDSGCVINNAGLCETSADQPFGHINGGVPTFNNTGTFRKLGDNETAISLKVIFNNFGILDVASNTLSFISGTHTLSGGSRLTGAGQTRIDGATVAWIGAITNTAPLELASGVVLASGSINGTVTWSGGTWKGDLDIPPASDLRLVGTGTKNLQAINLTNRGSILLEGGGALAFTDDAIIQNQGLFELQEDNSFTVPNGGKKWLNNYGVLRKKNSTRSFVLSGVLLQNSGTLDILAGSVDLTLNGHGLNAGSRVTGPGSLRVDGATLTLAGGVQSDAPLQLLSGILAGNGTLTGPLSWSGGTISGSITNLGNSTWSGGELSGTVVVNGAMDWSGGTLSGSLLVPGASQLTVSGSGNKLLTGTLQNAGRTTVQDPATIQLVSGTPLANSGTFETQSDAPFKVNSTSKPVFNNTGTLRRSGSNKAVDFGAMLLQNSGTLDLQTSDFTFSLNNHSFADGTRTMGAGAVRVTGGTLNINGTATLDAPFELASGILGGTATLNANRGMTWSGGTIPSGSGAGVFTVNGNLAWTAGTLSPTSATGAEGEFWYLILVGF
jgi:hypothetical protein